MQLKALELVQQGGFKLPNGDWYALTSNIDKDEILFLQSIITQYKPKKTLEIGCAEGTSSLAICELIGKDGQHTIIDPFQTTEWQSHGINNLKAAGFENFSLIEERSEIALPMLLKEGKTYDFIFVDGWHTFDHVMVEFFYINRMLPVGGVVVFDDTSLAGLNKLMRYISNYPNYECLGSAGEMPMSGQRKTLNTIKGIVNVVFSPFGEKVKRELLNDTVVRPDNSIKLNGSITAFRKTADDDRGWAWYEQF